MKGFEVELRSTLGPKALSTYEALFTNGKPPALVVADRGLPCLDGRWLQSHRSAEAMYWNLLTDLSPKHLSHAL